MSNKYTTEVVWESKTKGVELYSITPTLIKSNNVLKATIQAVSELVNSEDRTDMENPYKDLKIVLPNRFIQKNFEKDLGFYLCAKNAGATLKTYFEYGIDFDGEVHKEPKRRRRATILIFPYYNAVSWDKIDKVIRQLNPETKVILIGDEFNCEATREDNYKIGRMDIIETTQPYLDATPFFAANFKLVLPTAQRATDFAWNFHERITNRKHLDIGDKCILIRKNEQGSDAQRLLWVDVADEFYFNGTRGRDNDFKKIFSHKPGTKGGYCFGPKSIFRPAYAYSYGEVLGLPEESRLLVIGTIQDVVIATDLAKMGYQVIFLLNNSDIIV